MEIEKIPLKILNEMNSKGFIEITPYIHHNLLVRWIFWRRLKTMISLAKQKKRVLDFGAGSGIFMPTLAKNFSEVYSADINTKSLNYLKKHYNYKNVKIINLKKSSLSFKDEFFDIIFAADVLEHVKNLEVVLKELKRILKKNGLLIVSGPTENQLYKLARKIIYKKKQDSKHYRNIDDIIKESSRHFKIEKIKVIPNKLIQGFKIYKSKKIII